MKKISLIIPAYNVDKYLEKCLDSVLEQTFQDYEVILVNDGSTDNTLYIGEKYRKKDSRIRLISQQNQGLGAARNIGICASAGSCISFLDADDWLDNKCLERMVEVQEKTGSEIVVVENVRFNTKTGTYTFTTGRDAYVCTFTPKEWFTGDRQRPYNIYFNTAWGKLYDRKLFSTLRYPKRTKAEDEYTTYKAYLLADKISYVHEPLYIYRREIEGAITSTSPLTERYPLESLEEMITLLACAGIEPELMLKVYKERLGLRGGTAIRQGDYETFRKESFIREVIQKYK